MKIAEAVNDGHGFIITERAIPNGLPGQRLGSRPSYWAETNVPARLVTEETRMEVFGMIIADAAKLGIRPMYTM